MDTLKQRIKDDIEALPNMEFDIAHARDIYPWALGVVVAYAFVAILAISISPTGLHGLDGDFELISLAGTSVVMFFMVSLYRTQYITLIQYLRVSVMLVKYTKVIFLLFLVLVFLITAIFGSILAGFIASLLLTKLYFGLEMNRIGMHVLLNAIGTVIDKIKSYE
jgi:hypothetical protein